MKSIGVHSIPPAFHYLLDVGKPGLRGRATSVLDTLEQILAN